MRVLLLSGDIGETRIDTENSAIVMQLLGESTRLDCKSEDMPDMDYLTDFKLVSDPEPIQATVDSDLIDSDGMSDFFG